MAPRQHTRDPTSSFYKSQRAYRQVQQPVMVDSHVESLISSSLDHKSTAPKDATQFVIFETAGDVWLGRGRPNRQQWGFYTPTPRLSRSVLLDLWLPWTLFPVPIVLFAAFTITWSLSSFLLLNLTQAQVFAAPPYLWSIQTIGFTNFAMLVGALIGLFTAGPFSDWVSYKLTVKNGGIREPEMRLPALVPYVVIMYIGNIIVCLGYQHHWTWPPIVIIGYTCAGIQVAAIPGIVSTYAVDSYMPVAGSLFVTVTVIKNLYGYGVGRFLTDWIVDAGFVVPFMVNASISLFFCLCGIVFYIKGKAFRRWTKDREVNKM